MADTFMKRGYAQVKRLARRLRITSTMKEGAENAGGRVRVSVPTPVTVPLVTEGRGEKGGPGKHNPVAMSVPEIYVKLVAVTLNGGNDEQLSWFAAHLLSELKTSHGATGTFSPAEFISACEACIFALRSGVHLDMETPAHQGPFFNQKSAPFDGIVSRLTGMLGRPDFAEEIGRIKPEFARDKKE